MRSYHCVEDIIIKPLELERPSYLIDLIVLSILTSLCEYYLILYPENDRTISVRSLCKYSQFFVKTILN